MHKINILFFELIQVAIGTRICLSHMPSADEWGELYAMAKKQSLVGVCFAGVQKLVNQQQEPPEMLYLTWMGMAAKIQQRNEEVTKQCAELQARLALDGLSSVVLKGQSVAEQYGTQLSALRQSGDIDLWVDAPRDSTVEYVMKRCPTTEVNFQHVHYHVFGDTDVELHMVPVSRYNPRRNRILQEYFDSEVKRQCGNQKMIWIGSAEVELSVPTEDFQLVHQLLHVYSHYVYEGVGLRQLMDLYFAQRAMKNGEELFRVQELFRRLGLGRFVAATQWVLKEVFLLPTSELIWEPDAKEGAQMLEEVMEGGNFGHYSEKNAVRGESTMHRMWRRFEQNVRMIRFDFLGVICGPWYRLRIGMWRKSIARKYNV